MKRIILHFLALFFIFPIAHASHNYAAWIEVDHNGGNVYTFRLITLTDPAPALVDRCEVHLSLKDQNGNVVAVLQNVPRQNGTSGTDPVFPSLSCSFPATNGIYTVLVPTGSPTTPIGNSTIKRSVYQAQFSLTQPGTYRIEWTDNAWVSGISNMQNSGSTSLEVYSTFLVDPQLNSNSTPRPQNDSTALVCLGQPFIYSPAWLESNGDSLHFQVTPVVMATGYTYPDLSGGGNFYVDQQLGTLYWLNSNQLGIYAVAIRADEYRNGNWIGTCVFQFLLFTQSGNCTVERDFEAGRKWGISPNPSGGKLEISGLSGAPVFYELLNANGQSVGKGSLNANQPELNLDGFSGGMYFLKIHGLGCQKIILEK
ncbi:MAG: T9SS type A sorting domain-containing protein [Bacteroidia bacterium]|nr:T9SS type A sorting domain-containing protein [Bacteroidia bacterium]